MTDASLQVWTGDDLSDDEFSAITELLKERRQFDLGQYKDRCIRRRIAKRLRACKVTDFSAYLNRLTADREELDTLLATISIHVSQFFRNPDTFRIIEQRILPDLCRLARAAGRSELTLWSAGCASGEEPYSLALLVDALGVNDINIKVLASDISEPVLETARKATYDTTRLKEVPKEVLDRYFLQADGRYQLIDRVRDKVDFIRPDSLPQRHDLLYPRRAGTHPGTFCQGPAGAGDVDTWPVRDDDRHSSSILQIGVSRRAGLSPQGRSCFMLTEMVEAEAKG